VPTTPHYVLTFAPVAHPEVPPIARLRRLLKMALRSYGLRCVDCREQKEVKPVNVHLLFVLDGQYERPAGDWPFLPRVGDLLSFGPEHACARVSECWYFEAENRWEVMIDRPDEVSSDDMTVAEIEAWQAAGFDVCAPPPAQAAGPAPW